MGAAFFHLGGDGAGGFVALVELIDDLVIALFVTVLAEFGGGLVFGDQDLETDDAAEIVMQTLFGDLFHMHGLRQVVLVGVDQTRESGLEGVSLHDLYSAVYMYGEIIPGGHL